MLLHTGAKMAMTRSLLRVDFHQFAPHGRVVATMFTTFRTPDIALRSPGITSTIINPRREVKSSSSANKTSLKTSDNVESEKREENLRHKHEQPQRDHLKPGVFENMQRLHRMEDTGGNVEKTVQKDMDRSVNVAEDMRDALAETTELAKETIRETMKAKANLPKEKTPSVHDEKAKKNDTGWKSMGAATDVGNRRDDKGKEMQTGVDDKKENLHTLILDGLMAKKGKENHTTEVEDNIADEANQENGGEKRFDEVNNLTENIKNMADDVVDKAYDMGNKGAEMMREAANIGKEMTQSILDKANRVERESGQVAENALENAKQMGVKGREMTNEATEKGKKKAEELVDMARDIGEKGMEMANETMESSKRKANEILDKPEDETDKKNEDGIASEAIKHARHAAEELKGTLLHDAKEAAHYVAEKAENATDTVKSATDATVRMAVEQAEKLYGKVSNQLPSATSTGESTGGEDKKSMVKDVYDAFKSTAQEWRDALGSEAAPKEEHQSRQVGADLSTDELKQRQDEALKKAMKKGQEQAKADGVEHVPEVHDRQGYPPWSLDSEDDTKHSR